MKRSAVFLALLVLLLITSVALAMESTNYRLDWFTPLTGGGGGPASSTSYGVNFTVGQTAIGVANSTNGSVGLGYWYGMYGGRLYLPIVTKH